MPKIKKRITPLKTRIIDKSDYPSVQLKIPQDHIAEKTAFGLAEWAIKQMGEDFNDYLNQAREDYLFEIYGKTKENPTSVQIGLAIIKTPLKFPVSLRKRSRSKYQKLAFRLFREFQTLRPLVRKIKREARTLETNPTEAFSRIFLGVPRERLENYREMEPADIIYDYLVWRYSLDLEPETLKENLAKVKKIGGTYPGILEVTRTIDLWIEDTVPSDSMLGSLISNPYLF